MVTSDATGKLPGRRDSTRRSTVSHRKGQDGCIEPSSTAVTVCLPSGGCASRNGPPAIVFSAVLPCGSSIVTSTPARCWALA